MREKYLKIQFKDFKVNFIYLTYVLINIVQKVKLKPLDLGESFGIPSSRKVLFRRLTFTKDFNKLVIEISKKKQ